MRRTLLPVLAVTAAALLAACGGGSSSSTTNTGPLGYFLVITRGTAGVSFSPVTAPSGATITVVNNDTQVHEISSEVTSGSHTPGAPVGVQPFDTGPFTGTTTVQVRPSDAGPITSGTVIPFYCKQHPSEGDGTILIQANAPPTGGGY